MNLFSQPTPKADPEKIRQLKTWVYELLAIDSDIPISISQLRCTEPNCPPIETVIAIMTVPPKQHKIHCSIAEIDYQTISDLSHQKSH